MEEVKKDEVKVEVVEGKKKFFTKKKVLAIGGGAAALILLGVALLSKKDKDHEAEGKKIIEAFETPYEPVTNSEVE